MYTNNYDMRKNICIYAKEKKVSAMRTYCTVRGENKGTEVEVHIVQYGGLMKRNKRKIQARRI